MSDVGGGDAAEPFGLCWGQQWSWHEQQAPAARRDRGLLLSDVMDLPGGVDRDGVREAIDVLLTRHAALRTSYLRDAGGAPWQRVWPADRRRYQLAEFDDAERCRAWLEQPLDIVAGWPLRVALLPAGLGVAVHQVAADRYGFRLLCEELRLVAGAVARGVAPSLPPVGRQPADIAAQERSPAGRTASARAIAYWLTQDEPLGEVLDALRSRSDEPSDVMHVARAVSASGRRRLAQLAASTGSSEPTVAVAAVACVLAGHLGRTTFPLTTLVNNRHLPGLARSVCSVAQSGLIRASVSDPDDLVSAIPDAWSGTLAAMQHAHYDGDELSDRMRSFDSGGVHTTAAPPSVNVVVQDAPSVAAGAGAGPWTASVRQVDQRCVSLYFHAHVSESHLSIELRVGSHLVSAGEAEGLVTGAMRLVLG
jgi:hypothetical protein